MVISSSRIPTESNSQNFLISSFKVVSASDRLCENSTCVVIIVLLLKPLSGLILGTGPLTNHPNFDERAAKPELSFFLTFPSTKTQYKSAPIKTSISPEPIPSSAKSSSFKNEFCWMAISRYLPFIVSVIFGTHNAFIDKLKLFFNVLILNSYS